MWGLPQLRSPFGCPHCCVCMHACMYIRVYIICIPVSYVPLYVHVCSVCLRLCTLCVPCCIQGSKEDHLPSQKRLAVLVDSFASGATRSFAGAAPNSKPCYMSVRCRVTVYP